MEVHSLVESSTLLTIHYLIHPAYCSSNNMEKCKHFNLPVLTLSSALSVISKPCFYMSRSLFLPTVQKTGLLCRLFSVANFILSLPYLSTKPLVQAT